jgi:hypothetical protein
MYICVMDIHITNCNVTIVTAGKGDQAETPEALQKRIQSFANAIIPVISNYMDKMLAMNPANEPAQPFSEQLKQTAPPAWVQEELEKNTETNDLKSNAESKGPLLAVFPPNFNPLLGR